MTHRCIVVTVLALGALSCAANGATLPGRLFADGFEASAICAASQPSYTQGFDLPDGSPLPAEWSIAGALELADVQQGRARLRPVPSNIAPGRVVADVPTMDVEARFTFWMEDVSRQGVGFYVRQNGGHLDQTVPPGEGYVVFLEGFSGTSLIGIWRERQGSEQRLLSLPTPFDFEDNVGYRVRMRVNQMSVSQTFIQAKVWALGDAEPVDWDIHYTDDQASLQGVEAGIALDVFTLSGGAGSPSGYFDDIEVEALCNPLAGRGPLQTLAQSFTFTEGPVWRDGHLLFTELATPGNAAATAILRLDPPDGFSSERTPSGHANGLALNAAGDLLACEHASRRVSVTPVGEPVSTLVSDYLGAAFNSPNDLILRSDGTLFFTDPSYGMAAHGQSREIGFNGLYRRTPDGVLSAEWQGAIGAEEPNGVALSPDELTLYATDTAQGLLLAWDVAIDGALSNRRVLRSGLDTPDGLCVDQAGHVFVATWDQAVEVFSGSGVPFGRIALGRDATNCAFGGDDGRTLFVTAQDTLYSLQLVLPGLR